MKIFLTIIILFLLQMFAQAQYKTEGHVTVIQDDLVDSLLQQYQSIRTKINENPENKGIPGFRIQIFFDSGLNSSDRAKSAMEDFLGDYPDIPAYLSWKAPNYRVRIGDFRTRLEAEKTLQLISKDYPNAWVIKDEINYPQID